MLFRSLSDKNKPLYSYFKQLFAQVTNPPIDPIREAIVMSLVSFVGPKPNLLDINAVNPPMRLEVPQPILDFDDMARLREIEKHTIHAATMVTAGIFMVARMSPLFELSDTALNFILIIGAITALFMGFLGIIQNDIKRDRKSTRLNSSHPRLSRMPSSA